MIHNNSNSQLSARQLQLVGILKLLGRSCQDRGSRRPSRSRSRHRRRRDEHFTVRPAHAGTARSAQDFPPPSRRSPAATASGWWGFHNNDRSTSPCREPVLSFFGSDGHAVDAVVQQQQRQQQQIRGWSRLRGCGGGAYCSLVGRLLSLNH